MKQKYIIIFKWRSNLDELFTLRPVLTHCV